MKKTTIVLAVVAVAALAANFGWGPANFGWNFGW